ncbi:helix-turn-helix domain-containing protein, partial [Enterococcus casseliflavus]
MAKYPFELKLKIVKEYLSGVGGYRYLANKYGISSKSQVSNWVNAYREYGEEGL